VAVAANAGSRARLGPAAPAGGAVLRAGNLDCGLQAGGGLLQGDAHIIAQVPATRRAPAAATPSEEHIEDALSASARPAPAKAESPQQILEVDPPEEVLLRVLAVDAGMAELVVLLPLLRIGEDGVGLGDLLELLLRAGLLGAVRMVLHGQLAVSSLDVLLA